MIIISDSVLIAKNTIQKLKDLEEGVPLWLRELLTIEQASKLYNIGINRLRAITDDVNCPFVVYVGSKRMIKRRKFTAYLNSDLCYSI